MELITIERKKGKKEKKLKRAKEIGSLMETQIDLNQRIVKRTLRIILMQSGSFI